MEIGALRVANKPIAAFAVEALVANGLTEVTIVAGYRREKLQTHFGDGKASGARITYAFQGALLGTAHALAQVDFRGDDVLVMGDDNVVDAQLVEDLPAARGRGPDMPAATTSPDCASPRSRPRQGFKS